MRRRSFIRSLLATSFASAAAPGIAQSQPRVAVIGAGAFGGWTALSLLRRGAKVTLLDAWGPGHSRSSSGGESRVIRHSYGKKIYVDMAKRSLKVWADASDAWGRPLLHVSGVLHMLENESAFAAGVRDTELLRDAQVPHELVDHSQLVERYPQVNLDDVESALYEPTAGYILARRACQAVVDAFVQEGGQYISAYVQPGDINSGRMAPIFLSNGERLAADQYVFACGPWLKSMFSDVLGPHLSVSRQEMFYFGTPATDRRYDAGQFPVWTSFGDTIWYGIPGGEQRGFKMADDAHGPEHDPSTSERIVSDGGLIRARQFLAHRFPGLANAPLIESRVCQYTNTPDGDFIADKHPQAKNVWLLGGGSGHGFKHGPAFGEMAAAQVLDEADIEATFSLSRFA